MSSLSQLPADINIGHPHTRFTIAVQIKEQHIRKGKVCNGNHCPVALAITDAINGRYIDADDQTTALCSVNVLPTNTLIIVSRGYDDGDWYCSYKSVHEPALRKWIKKYDDMLGKVNPRQFNLLFEYEGGRPHK